MTDHPCGCNDETLSDLVHDELGPEEKRRVAIHATGCPRCAQQLGGLFAAKAALSVPAPGKVALPRVFWREVRGRLDQVDGLIRATNLTPRRPVLNYRPALAVGLALVTVVCLGKVYLSSQGDVLSQIAAMHQSALATAGRPGMEVGYGPHSQWQPLVRHLSHAGRATVMQTTYDMGGLPVSVFRLPAERLNTASLVPVQVGRETLYLGTLEGSSLAAVPHGDAWEIIVARTSPENLMRLAVSRPQGVPLPPGF